MLISDMSTLFLFLHLFFYLLFLQEFNFGAVWCFCIHYSAFCCPSSQKGWHHNATLMQNHKTTWNEQTTTAYNGTHLRPKPCPIPWIDTGERSWPGVNHVLFLCYFIFALNVNFPPSFKGGLWSRTANFSCVCHPTSTNEFCTTAKTGMGVPHVFICIQCDSWRALSPLPLPQYAPGPLIVLCSREYF